MIQEIGEIKLEESYKTCYETFLLFSKKMNFDETVVIDERILMHSICDAYADIARLKNFHQILNENGIKTLAYRCSWLLKRKPIKVLNNSVAEDLVYVNEKFVYFLIMSYLFTEEIDIKSTDSDTTSIKNYLDSLLYYLKYRSCTPQVLEMIILSFEAGEIYKKLAYEAQKQ